MVKYSVTLHPTDKYDRWPSVKRRVHKKFGTLRAACKWCNMLVETNHKKHRPWGMVQILASANYNSETVLFFHLNPYR